MIDVLNFEIQANASKDDRINAEREYMAAMTGLAALLGIPEARFPEGLTHAPLEDESERIMQLPQAGEQVAYAHEHRPDVQASASGIDRPSGFPSSYGGPDFGIRKHSAR